MLSNCPVVEHEGSGYIIYNTSKSLTALGHEVTLIPPSTFGILPRFFENRAKIYRLILGMANWVLFNKKRISKQDLIIFYGAESFLALFIIKNLFKINTPVVLHSNGLEVHVGFKLNSYGNFFSIIKKWYHRDLSKFFKYSYRNVDAIITLSKYDSDFAIENLKLSPHKVYYNEPALPDIFFNYKKSEVVPTKNKIITYCGTWIDRKGVKSIEGAIPTILRKYKEYTFRIIGVGEDFKVENYFPADIHHRIEVYPLVRDKSDLIKMYYETSIFLFPSFCESFGLVVPEAMFCGSAVITGATGFAANLKNNEEALVLNIPNTPNVTAALDKLISNDKLLSNLAERAQERTENLNWASYKKELNNIITNIIEKSDFHEVIEEKYQVGNRA